MDKLGGMRSVEDHQRVVAGLITARPAAEVPAGDAQGLVLAGDVVAPLSLPVFDNSAMDGYAVRTGDVQTVPVIMPVAEDIPAGRTDRLTLTPGTAHRIMTGAPVPAGADAVVPVEATDAGLPEVEIRSSAKPGQHIRRAGEDVAAGTAVLRAGHAVSPAALGLVAALGLDRLAVIPRQRVLVISTGSELVALRIQRGDARRGGTGGRRRGRRGGNLRRRRRPVPRGARCLHRGRGRGADVRRCQRGGL
jgi:molybdopterin molybdotransferase